MVKFIIGFLHSRRVRVRVIRRRTWRRSYDDVIGPRHQALDLVGHEHGPGGSKVLDLEGVSHSGLVEDNRLGLAEDNHLDRVVANRLALAVDTHSGQAVDNQ